MTSIDNIQNLQIKAKKISSLDTFPSNYNLNQKNNNYLLLSCLEDNNTRKNYKISLEQIINYVYNQVSESVASDNDTNINTIKDELIQLIESYHAVHTITYNLTNVINNDNPNSIIGKTPTLLTFNNSVGYLMPDNVDVIGASYEYNKNNKTINLLNIFDNVVITINATDKLICLFTSQYADSNHNIRIELLSDTNEFIINDTFDIKLELNYTGSNSYRLPEQLNCTGCSIVSYNSLTGDATLKCTGTNQLMKISGNIVDNTSYTFSYAVESNSNVFIKSNNIITDINWENLEALSYTNITNGRCGFNFNTGITWDSSVDVVGESVWIIMPSKYFSSPNIIKDDNNNKYNFIDPFGNPLSSIKSIININYAGIEYILFNISNNGVTGTQKFKRI
jgi:hypothetical protein